VQLLSTFEFLPLLAQDGLVYRLGDPDERDFPRDLDQREAHVVSCGPHRIGKAREVMRHGEPERRDSMLGEPAHKFGQLVVATRPGDAGAQYQHPPVDPGKRIR